MDTQAIAISELRGRVLALEAQVRILQGAKPDAAERPPRSLSESDLRVLRIMLPALANIFPAGTNFVVREALRDVARYNVEAALAVVNDLGADGKDPSRRFGRLLARAIGHEVAGVRVHRLGDVRVGGLWKLERVS